jgi:hypothetical protein
MRYPGTFWLISAFVTAAIHSYRTKTVGVELPIIRNNTLLSRQAVAQQCHFCAGSDFRKSFTRDSN